MKKSWHQQFKRASAAERTSADGIEHASTSEMKRWCKLQFDEKLGLVRNLRRQVAHPLRIDDDRAVRTPTGRVAIYKPDFIYERLQGNGEWVEVIEDIKGHLDKLAAFRISVFEAIYGKTVFINKR
jgi:hypothetical protein